jgi:hypothetical protein
VSATEPLTTRIDVKQGGPELLVRTWPTGEQKVDMRIGGAWLPAEVLGEELAVETEGGWTAAEASR